MKISNSTPWQATLTDWCIVLHPQIYYNIENPDKVFAKLNCGQPVALFGRAINDPRYNAEKGDAFADGHRLITSPIIAVKNEEYHTADTIYTLDEAFKSSDFKEWCIENQYKEVSLDGVWESNGQENMVLRHLCEVCSIEMFLSSAEAYRPGWDYPPKMGSFGIISPRTCPDCSINETLWWEITYNNTPPDQLSERHQNTLKRILTEPESIMP